MSYIGQRVIFYIEDFGMTGVYEFLDEEMEDGMTVNMVITNIICRRVVGSRGLEKYKINYIHKNDPYFMDSRTSLQTF
jgi:hypothetical protein